MLRTKYFPTAWVAGLSLLLAGCGGSSNQVTGLTKRVLLSNALTTGGPSGLTVTGGLTIVDGEQDLLAKDVTAMPFSKMVTAGGMTVLESVGTSQISVFDNATEQVTGSATLQGPPSDIAISTDGLTAYAAVRSTAALEVIGTANANVAFNLTVPSAARLVEGPNEHKLLAFADDPQNLVGSTNGVPNANSFFILNTSDNTITAVQLPAGSQPYTGVFDPSDPNDTTAFILNCGTECGGSAPPSVVKVNFSAAGAPVFTPNTPIAVSGATVGLLSGSNLFIAGTPPGSPTGTLQVINTGAMTAGAPFTITNGLHAQMALTSNNRLYIGASNCSIGAPDSQDTVAGCLSIFDTSANVVRAIPRESALRQNFNVTGLQPISSRNVIYVCQGGELDIFDITLDAPSPSITQIDVVGNAMDVVQIDP